VRLPIPQLQRRAPQEATAGPQTSGVPAFGLADLGAAMFNVGANAQHAANVEAEQAAREAQQRAARIEHEQRKARVIERIRDDRLKWLDEMQRRKTEAPEGADGFTPKALADFDTYRKKAVEQIPDEEERGMYDGLLGDLREHVGQTALVFQSDSRARYRARVIAEGADKSARLVAADPAQLQQVLAQELALIAGADGLAADAKAQLAERTRDTLAWSAAQTIVDRDPDGFLARAGMTGGKTGKDGKVKPSDPAKALAAVQSDPILSNLPPQRLQQAIEKATMLSVTRKAQAEAEAERARARAEAAANKREREANQAFTILSGYLRDGRVVDMTSPDNQKLVAKLAGTPYAAALGTMAQQAPANAAAATLPIPQQEAELSALYTRRNASGTSPALEDEIERREKVLKAAKGDYQRNPITAAVERGVLKQAAPLDLTSIDSIRASLPARSEQAKVAARQAGRPAVSPFDDAEAEAVARQLSTLSWQDFGARVAELTAGMTPMQAQAFAAQINQKDRGLALALAAGTSMTSEGRTVAALVRRGQETVRDKGFKEDSGAEFGLRAQISKHLGDALGGQAKDDVIDAARLIYLGKAGAGEDVSVTGAVRLALGGTLAEHNGRTIPVAAGVDDLAKRLREYPLYDLARQTKGGAALINGQPVPVEALWRALPGMQLEPVSVGRYTVRTGGHAVLTPERTPIVIEVR
jgi:hypothetical protein